MKEEKNITIYKILKRIFGVEITAGIMGYYIGDCDNNIHSKDYADVKIDKNGNKMLRWRCNCGATTKWECKK